MLMFKRISNQLKNHLDSWKGWTIQMLFTFCYNNQRLQAIVAQ